MDGTEVTIATLLETITTVFGEAIDWVAAVGNEIVSTPILLLFCVIPLIGLGVGLFRRLINVN